MENLVKIPSSKYILDSSREFSLYVCENRAIPKISDGLKDSQRKALWLMKSKSDKIKTVSLAGEMISSGLYLHGDGPAASSIGMLAAPYCNNIPLLDGIGNFGTRVSPNELSSPRYTYVKKSKFADYALFKDLNLIPLKDNYDGSTKEPENFLPLIPLILLNGVSGIAVGWSTEILPHSFSDILNATINVIDGKKVKNLEPKYEYLDITTKNVDVNTWEFYGKLKIVDTSTVDILELPPDLTLEKIKERLNAYEDEDKIVSYEDNSRDTINLRVKFKRGTLKGYTEEKLIDFFKLKSRKVERIVVIDWNNNSIKQYETPEEIIYDFVSWRLEYYKKRYQVLIDETKKEMNYFEAIINCFKHKLNEKVSKLKNKKELVFEIKSVNPLLSDEDADKISLLPTYNWTIEYLDMIREKVKKCKDNIKDFTSILNDETKLRAVYKEELLELKKTIK